MIKRFYDELNLYMKPGKVLVLYGPRRVGKTTLVKNFLSKQINTKYIFDDGTDINIQETLSSLDLTILKRYVGNNNVVVIDEAQNVPNIGNAIKLIVDHIEGVQIIITGSSSLDLVNSVGDPLTGRSTELLLYPISQLELSSNLGQYHLERNNEEYLIFGSYPEVLTLASFDEKSKYLLSLVNSYILRDILSLEKVKGSKILLDLLRLLAFQIGSEVSLSELSDKLNIDAKTISRYLDLLEKSFIIYRLGSFSGNLRSEVTKKSKYFFFDNGVRNALINNFNTLNLRDDEGKLWENFLLIERIKRQRYLDNNVNSYFWRTYEQKEVDYIEDIRGNISAYEFKYSNSKTNKGIKEFQMLYPKSEVNIIDKSNYLDFICLNLVNLVELPIGRILLQIQHEYPYLKKDIDRIIDNIKGYSNDQWISVKEQLAFLKNDKVEKQDIDKFQELIDSIIIKNL